MDIEKLFGRNLTALLDTPAKRTAFEEIFTVIADREGPDIARAWMVGMNPLLGDDDHRDGCPLLWIAGGRAEAVAQAARSVETHVDFFGLGLVGD